MKQEKEKERVCYTHIINLHNGLRDVRNDYVKKISSKFLKKKEKKEKRNKEKELPCSLSNKSTVYKTLRNCLLFKEKNSVIIIFLCLPSHYYVQHYVLLFAYTN